MSQMTRSEFWHRLDENAKAGPFTVVTDIDAPVMGHIYMRVCLTALKPFPAMCLYARMMKPTDDGTKPLVMMRLWERPASCSRDTVLYPVVAEAMCRALTKYKTWLREWEEKGAANGRSD